MSSERIILQDGEAQVTGGDGANVRTKLGGFARGIARATVSGLNQEALADNEKWRVPCGPLTISIVELKPELRLLKWIDEDDSAALFGSDAKYNDRRLATPYVLLKVPFLKVRIVNRVELFFRTEPVRNLDDELYWSNLLNVSPYSYGCTAWLCTQYLKTERPAEGITNGLDALVKHLWGGGFNRSSDVNEGSSAFSKAKSDGADARVTDVDRWEAESVGNPRFVLGVKWKPVGMTIRQLIEAELKFHRVVRNFDSVGELVSVLLGSRNGRKGDS